MPTPPRTIDLIRERIDLVALISGYVKLRRAGVQHVGLCPFHAERTPSFTVHPAKQLYCCHGCGAAGDAFTFIQRIETLSFPAALELLAAHAGVPLDDDLDTRERRRQYRLQREQAQQLAQECAWFVGELRRMLWGWHDLARRSQARATAWLAERVDAPDSPGVDYAWWWVARGDGVMTYVQAEIAALDAADPAEVMQWWGDVRVSHLWAMAAYRTHEREERMWTRLVSEMVDVVGAPALGATA